MTATAHIALGSNLGDRHANLRAALERLGDTPGIKVVRVSSFLENPAVGGPADNPPFVNAAAELATVFGPAALLRRMLEVERSLGRERSAKWGPRTIDLDLVLFGDAVLDTPELKVPHPLMHEREFVLQPLAEIAPDARHPTLKRTVRELLDEPPRRPAADRPAPLRLTLRPATAADGQAIRDLVFSVLREYGLAPDPCGTDLDLSDVEGHYALRGGRFDVLADDAGTIRGTVGIDRVDARSCELRKMYLHRSARGQGWGRRLLDHAIAEARRMGFKRMTLETASVLTEAVALYERYGFKPFSPDPAHKAPRCDAAYELDLTI